MIKRLSYLTRAFFNCIDRLVARIYGAIATVYGENKNIVKKALNRGSDSMLFHYMSCI